MQIEEFVSNYNSIYVTNAPPSETRLNFLFGRVFSFIVVLFAFF